MSVYRRLFGELRLAVPMLPPSVNRYVRHTRSGAHYRSSEALRWEAAVAIATQGNDARAWRDLLRGLGPSQTRWLCWEVYVEYTIGPGSRGDVDNRGKCVLDALQAFGMIHTDDRVLGLVQRKERGSSDGTMVIVSQSHEATTLAWARRRPSRGKP